ncbi:MAG: hypothetical protein QNL91_13600 [Candidatus Krumholzibacteria bacterium]|nr:hypothetical protein [Candidatus Krumholzibacteria bacterium]
MFSKISFLACFVVTTLFLSPVYAVDYWPSTVGQEFVYQEGLYYRGVSIREGSIPDTFMRFSSGISGAGGRTYKIDENGDVLGLGQLGYFWYDSPYLFLDLPLEVGKTWSSHVNEYFFMVPDQPRWVTFSYEVIESETIIAPAGTFEALVVKQEKFFDSSPETIQTFIYKLNILHGPVEDLFSWTEVVANEPHSWGSVKALYR